MPALLSQTVIEPVLQLVVVSVALAAAALTPPAHGTLLAVPLTGAREAETINLAVANGARIEGEGPVAGWIVLRGDRERLAGPLRAHGIMLLAGSSGMCRS